MNWINQVGQAGQTVKGLVKNHKKQESMNGWLSAGLGMAGNAISMIGQRGRERRANRQNERMQDRQFANQKALNQQGHDLSMDLWNKTNYGAQMEHLKEAGLNPALMYGQAGAGGSTSNSSGGSASGGGTISPQSMMDISAIDGLMKMAEIELKKAQTKNVDADTENKGEGGVVRNEAEARINKMIAETDNEALKGVLLEVEESKSLQELENLKVTEGMLKAGKSKAEYDAESAEFERDMMKQDRNEARDSGISRLNRNAQMLLWRAGGKSLNWLSDFWSDSTEGKGIPVSD